MRAIELIAKVTSGEIVTPEPLTKEVKDNLIAMGKVLIWAADSEKKPCPITLWFEFVETLVARAEAAGEMSVSE